MGKKEVLIVVLALVILGVSMIAANYGGDITGSLVRGRGKIIISVTDFSNDHPIRDARVYVDNLDDNRSKTFYVGRTRRDGTRDFLLDPSSYEIQIKKGDFKVHKDILTVKKDVEKYIEVSLIPLDYEAKCSDKTLYNTCARVQPLYCDNEGNLIARCDLCACPQGLRCNFDGSCF